MQTWVCDWAHMRRVKPGLLVRQLVTAITAIRDRGAWYVPFLCLRGDFISPLSVKHKAGHRSRTAGLVHRRMSHESWCRNLDNKKENKNITAQNKCIQALIGAAVVITVISSLFPHGRRDQIIEMSRHPDPLPLGRRWPPGWGRGVTIKLVAASRRRGGRGGLWWCNCATGVFWLTALTVHLDNSQGGRARGER